LFFFFERIRVTRSIITANYFPLKVIFFLSGIVVYTMHLVTVRRTIPWAIVLAGMLAMALIACGCTTSPGGPVTPTPTESPAPTETSTQVPWAGLPLYNESYNGETIAVSPGERFVIALGENPTTGYSWNATFTTGLVTTGEGYSPNPATQGLAGAGGIHYWIVEVPEPGAQQFSAVYIRSWEGVLPDDQTFSLNIIAGEVQTPPGKKLVTYTEADNGTTVSVLQGSMFAISLAENPTTGYSWNATISPGLELVDDQYLENAHAPGMVGVGGTHWWILRAVTAGAQEFSATYIRPWEGVLPGDQTYSLDIDVGKP
jgi:inhibitor of cysteine peptidase